MSCRHARPHRSVASAPWGPGRAAEWCRAHAAFPIANAAPILAVVDPDEPHSVAVTIGHAAADDAAGIAAVHVAVWRNAYSGLLPDHSLAGLSRPRLAVRYDMAIRHGAGVLVARAGAQVVGFATMSPSPTGNLAEGEVETLYVLDDWRERGIGRALLQAAARHLQALSCRSLFLWVLAQNPSRWFYERCGGRAAMQSITHVGGEPMPQIAMVWNRIETLAEDA